MPQTPLTPKQMDLILQALTLNMGLQLSNNPNGAQNPNYYGARCEWQQRGQPFPAITEDVVFVRSVEVDDQYNRVRDVTYSQSTAGSPPVITYSKTTQYTRVWEVFWCTYGPNSFDNARKLRTRLFDQDIHDQFAATLLYLVTDPAAPRRLPEEENGQWWERVDFSARFNEFVTEVYSQTGGYVSSVETTIQDQFDNKFADFTVES